MEYHVHYEYIIGDDINVYLPLISFEIFQFNSEYVLLGVR